MQSMDLVSSIYHRFSTFFPSIQLMSSFRSKSIGFKLECKMPAGLESKILYRLKLEIHLRSCRFVLKMQNHHVVGLIYRRILSGWPINGDYGCILDVDEDQGFKSHCQVGLGVQASRGGAFHEFSCYFYFLFFFKIFF